MVRLISVLSFLGVCCCSLMGSQVECILVKGSLVQFSIVWLALFYALGLCFWCYPTRDSIRDGVLGPSRNNK